jgi:hypothetical protein
VHLHLQPAKSAFFSPTHSIQYNAIQSIPFILEAALRPGIVFPFFLFHNILHPTFSLLLHSTHSQPSLFIITSVFPSSPAGSNRGAGNIPSAKKKSRCPRNSIRLRALQRVSGQNKSWVRFAAHFSARAKTTSRPTGTNQQPQQPSLTKPTKRPPAHHQPTSSTILPHIANL